MAHFWEGQKGLCERKMLPAILLHSCYVDSKSTKADPVAGKYCLLTQEEYFFRRRETHFGADLSSRKKYFSAYFSQMEDELFRRAVTSTEGVLSHWQTERLHPENENIAMWSILFIALGANIKKLFILYIYICPPCV